MARKRMLPDLRTLFAIASFLVIVLSAQLTLLTAADGDPLAIRRWSDGRIGIENHWGLRLVVVQETTSEETSKQSLEKQIALGAGIDHVWSRRVNEAGATWIPADGKETIANSIRVTSMFVQGNQARGLLVRTDGVSVVVLADSLGDDFEPSEQAAMDSVDVVVMPNTAQSSDSGVAKWIKALNPRLVLLPLESDDDAATTVGHNAIAISRVSAGDHQTRFVKFGSKPYTLSAEFESLIAKMEASCQRSQSVFKPLSANQLNFKPSNGTHTPRWNAEHMMGRQLLFFSEIFHAVDSTIPVMDLNPKQMPGDYVAAHLDWDGQEEARQMQRVSEFTRRFAYLLDGIQLDVRAPGSRWTLRGLLRQMERHYDDHTANTKQKFNLADWPTK